MVDRWTRLICGLEPISRGESGMKMSVELEGGGYEMSSDIFLSITVPVYCKKMEADGASLD